MRNTFAKSKQKHKINIVTKLMKQTIRNKDEETYYFKRCRNRHLWSFSIDFFHGHSSVNLKKIGFYRKAVFVAKKRKDTSKKTGKQK